MTSRDRRQEGAVTVSSAVARPRMWAGRRLALAVLAAATFSLHAGVAVAAPATVPASPNVVDAAAVPTAPAGTLLRSSPMSFYGITRPTPGTVGWRIEYVSTSALGQPTIVSGAVLVLRDRIASPRGVVGLAPGGHGLADKCAPTNFLARSTEPEIGTIDTLVKAGFVVALTDYEGLGTPGDHPFGVNLASGRNVLDAVRAARQLEPGGGTSAGLPVGLYGYSQGGGAVGSAVEQLPTYAPELTVSGAVVGGVLAYPYAIARGVDGTVWSGLAHAAMLGFDSAYGLGLYGDLNGWGRHLMQSTKRSCMDLLAPVMLHRLDWMFKRGNPLRKPIWKQRAAENSLGSRPASAPVYQYHGSIDQFMSYRDARRLRVQWCQAGSQVRFQEARNSEHFATEPVMRGPAVVWLGQRMAGKPDRGNC